MGDSPVDDADADARTPNRRPERENAECPGNRRPPNHSGRSVRTDSRAGLPALPAILRGPATGALADDVRGTARWASLLYRAFVVVLACVGVALVLSGFTPSATSDAASASDGPVERVVASATEWVADLAGSGPRSATPSDESGPFDRAALEREIHSQVNEERRRRGLDPLEFDPELREIARYHSADMAENGYVGHTSPDGETVADRYDRFGYDCRVSLADGGYSTGGENLYRTAYAGQTLSRTELADRAVDGWLSSPGHRENLLRDDWGREGVGVVVDVEGDVVRVYVTQNFC
jgi:uncharacterized protein YkwD